MIAPVLADNSPITRYSKESKLTHGKAAWLLPAIMLYAAGAAAATREDVERFINAQPPGTVLICQGEGSLSAGAHHVTVRNEVRGKILSLQNGRQRSRAESIGTVDGVVYARYTYKVTSWLEQDAEVTELDPDSVHVIFPESKKEADEIARFVRANGTTRLRFEEFDATHFPAWEIAPAPDDPTGMRYHCRPD